MFVEEGFRVRFANGETIDFYADSAAEKEGWMRALSEVVGKEVKTAKKWTDLVFAKQRETVQRAMRSESGQTAMRPSSNMRSGPPVPAMRQNSPQKRPSSSGNAPPPPVEKDMRHMAEQRRTKTKSMVF